jgi:hypothetical protein
MNYKELVMRSRELVFALLMLLALGGQAHAQEVPSVPATSTGNYNVVFTWPIESQWTWLQERVGPNGAWTYADTSAMTPAGGLSVNAPFNNKPPGTYYYRIEVYYSNEYGETWYSWSGEASVVVSGVGGGGPGPGPGVSQDQVRNQMRYAYSARIGDINGDARQDVFIQRTSGGVSGNGTLEKVILRRLADGTFTPDVPTSGQISTASAWPVSSTKIELVDPNVDGFVDLLLPQLGNVISGAGSQIVFSSGQLGVAASPKVLPSGPGTKYAKFMKDIALWVNDPGYFERNAPIVYLPVYGPVYVCDYWEYWNCWWDWGIVGYQAFYDVSQWDPDAVRMRYQFPVSNGAIQMTVNPGTTEARNIGTYFQNVFGVQALRGILGNNCYDYQYDPITGLPCIDFSFYLFISMPTEKGDCRLLTFGEQNQAIYQGIYILNAHEVRVCNRGAPVPFSSGYIMVPDGNVWVGPGSGLTWRDDYSNFSNPGRQDEFSYLLHELVHVYQYRNGGLSPALMGYKKARAAATGGYKYWPIPPGKSFWAHNIEQQGEMVQDRFRRQNGMGVARPSLNNGAEYEPLRDIIPVLQGPYIEE